MRPQYFIGHQGTSDCSVEGVLAAHASDSDNLLPRFLCFDELIGQNNCQNVLQSPMGVDDELGRRLELVVFQEGLSEVHIKQSTTNECL